MRVFEEVHDLHDLGLGALVASDVRKACRRLLFVVELGLRPADAHDPAQPAAHLLAGAASKPNKHSHHQADQDEGLDEAVTDDVLAVVPVTWTLCASSSGVRVVSSRAMGICEV